MYNRIDSFTYTTLRTFALTHNYNKWIYEIFVPYIGKHILEVGCGIGNLLLFVPAIKWLFGSLDENLNHYRRYQKSTLKKDLENVGFQIEKIFLHNFFGIFGWFINGKILKRKTFPILQPILYDKLVPVLAKIEKYIEPPIGMSLGVIAKKTK